MVKKIISLILVIMMLGVFVGVPRTKAWTIVDFYGSRICGDIYLIDANISEVWSMLNWELPQSCPSLELISTYMTFTNTHTIRTLGLVNKGIITQIVILIPVCASYVFIYYEGAIHCYPLILHNITDNCIVFTFGD
jgi:hypothetical protein